MKKEDMMFIIYNQLGRHMWMQRRPTNAHGRHVAVTVCDMFRDAIAAF